MAVVNPSQHFRLQSFWNDDMQASEEQAVLCTHIISDGPVFPDGHGGLLPALWPTLQHNGFQRLEVCIFSSGLSDFCKALASDVQIVRLPNFCCVALFLLQATNHFTPVWCVWPLWWSSSSADCVTYVHCRAWLVHYLKGVVLEGEEHALEVFWGTEKGLTENGMFLAFTSPLLYRW